MSFLEQITVLILTYNEAPNLRRTLEALRPFPEIVILDSGSTDATPDIASSFKNTRIVTRAFDTHAVQWNYGLTACDIRRTWVLALDADYVLSTTLVDEVSNLTPANEISAFRAHFRYLIDGQPLSGSLYPPLPVLFRRDRASYVQSGHTQKLVVSGLVEDLNVPIDHDDRKPLARWLQSQLNYAHLEAQHLLCIPASDRRLSDWIRIAGWPAPSIVFFYTYIWKRCFLDGRRGWFYVTQRTLVELLIMLEIICQRRIKHVGSSGREGDVHSREGVKK